jgi:hypothetical protein
MFSIHTSTSLTSLEFITLTPNYCWDNREIPEEVLIFARQIIETNQWCMDEVHINQHVNLQDNAMSHKKCQEFDIILQHSQQKKNPKSLMMIIQGIVGTRKYYLISCIKASFNMHSPYGKILILLLAPIGVATFNIEVTTILATLKISS